MPFAIIFTWVASFFGDKIKQVGWGYAKFGAWTLFVIASLTFLLSTLISMLNSVKVSVPASVDMVWGWVMPSNAIGCLTLILTAKVLRAMYDFKVRMATIKLESIR